MTTVLLCIVGIPVGYSTGVVLADTIPEMPSLRTP